jgi:hypothetical protein
MGQLFQDAGDDGERKSKQPGGLFARQRQSLHFHEFAANSIDECVAGIYVAAFSANCGGQVSRSWNEGDVQESLPTRFVWLPSAHAPSGTISGIRATTIVPNLARRRCSIQHTRSSPDARRLSDSEGGQEIVTFRGYCELSSRNVFFVSSSSNVGCTLPLASMTRDTSV